MKKLLVLTLALAATVSLFSIAAPTAKAVNDKPKHHHSIFERFHFRWKFIRPSEIKWHSF